MQMAKAAGGPHMVRMHPGRPANIPFRVALAVVFGFMSLLHGPVMTFAKANPDIAHLAESAGGHAAGHHHPAAHGEQSAPSMPDAVPVCYSLGCFVALESFVIGAPAASLIPIGTLSPTAARALVPAYLDPAVPPPRLQV